MLIFQWQLSQKEKVPVESKALWVKQNDTDKEIKRATQKISNEEHGTNLETLIGGF